MDRMCIPLVEPIVSVRPNAYGMYCKLFPGRAPPTTSIRGCPLTKTRLPLISARAVGRGARFFQVSVAGS